MNNDLLGVYHQNICRLGRKPNELTASLYPNFLHIKCFSEHNLKQNEINHISIDNYKLRANFCKQSFNKGGVCKFVHKTLKVLTINLKEFCKDKDLEACAVKSDLLANRICIITIYRSPSSNFQLFING